MNKIKQHAILRTNDNLTFIVCTCEKSFNSIFEWTKHETEKTKKIFKCKKCNTITDFLKDDLKYDDFLPSCYECGYIYNKRKAKENFLQESKEEWKEEF